MNTFIKIPLNARSLIIILFLLHISVNWHLRILMMIG